MKFGIVFFGFSSFFLTPLFAQQSVNLIELEKKADSLYYQLTEPRGEESYLNEKRLRKEILQAHKDTTSQAYKTAKAKKYASEALYLMERKHDYTTAIVASNKALSIIETKEKQDLFFKGHIYRFLYHQYAYNGDWTTALPLTKKTREIFMDTLVSNHKLVADVEFDIGFVTSRFGDMSTVIKQYELAKNKYISFQGKNSYDVGQKYMHLATVYGAIGYYKKELNSYLEAIKIWETIDYVDKSYQAIAYGNVSTWYLWHGDFTKAEQYLVKREDLIAKRKKEGKRWYNETFLGRTRLASLRQYADLYFYKGEIKKALEINDEILEFLLNYNVDDQKNDPNNVGLTDVNAWIKFRTIVALRFKADIIKKKEPDLAKALHEKALLIKRQNGLAESSLADLMYLGNYYLDRGDHNNAEKLLNKSIAAAKERSDEYAMIQLYAKQAVLAKTQDNRYQMNESYKKAFKLFQKDSTDKITLKNLKYEDCKPYGNVPLINLTSEAANNYASMYKKYHDSSYLKNALQLSTLASDMFTENNRDLKFSDKSYATISKVNEQLLGTKLLLKDRKDINKILEKTEQSKSRRVWKAFLNSNQRKNLNIPDSILEKENDLKAEQHYYKKALFIENEGDSLKNLIWKEKILDIENAIDTIDLWYQKRYPFYYNQTKKKFDLESLQNKLAKKQVVINYVFAETHVYAFTISKNKTNLVRIAKKERVEQLVRDFLKELKNRTSTVYFELSNKLNEMLLPASIHFEETKELIIVPDEVLHYLPFEILTDKNKTYLIQNHTVSYAPSLLLYHEQIGVKTTKKNKLGVFAPYYIKENEEDPDRGSLSKLKAAVVEGTTIAELFDGDFFTGHNLNKDIFMNEAKNYSILHLAMHASLNNIASEFSNLDFSTNTQNDKLFISELYGINVNADLAVLSACNTRVGVLQKGEGVTSVSRAFTYAGVPSTVTSLWKVPDKQTSQIMVSFYKYLKDGLSKNVALQKAKLDYLASTDDDLLKHPYYWAGFVISGNVEPITQPVSKWWWLLLTILIFLGFWYLKKKKLV